MTIKNNLIWYSLGMMAGGAMGYLYWLEIGCVSGSCAITSSPLWSSLYGGFLGYYLVDLGKRFAKRNITPTTPSRHE